MGIRHSGVFEKWEAWLCITSAAAASAVDCFNKQDKSSGQTWMHYEGWIMSPLLSFSCQFYPIPGFNWGITTFNQTYIQSNIINYFNTVLKNIFNYFLQLIKRSVKLLSFDLYIIIFFLTKNPVLIFYYSTWSQTKTIRPSFQWILGINFSVFQKTFYIDWFYILTASTLGKHNTGTVNYRTKMHRFLASNSFVWVQASKICSSLTHLFRMNLQELRCGVITHWHKRKKQAPLWKKKKALIILDSLANKQR